MLELIYHSSVFGPIRLDYYEPVVRVGRSEDNDLVLRHPSVDPHHCLLVFRGEKLLCLPCDDAVFAEADLEALTGPEYGDGEQIQIGEIRFNLAHSTQTVAIPEVHRPEARPGAATAREGPGQRRFYCVRCRVFVPQREIRRLGLVGHAKRYLCPKCSSLLELEPEPSKPLSGFRMWLRAARKRTTSSWVKH